MLINIWVKDKDTGVIHQVGTDEHDSLEMFDGVVHYYNLQNGEGTYGGTYEFVEAPDSDDYIDVTPEQLTYYSKLIHDDVKKIIEAREGAEDGTARNNSTMPLSKKQTRQDDGRRKESGKASKL